MQSDAHFKQVNKDVKKDEHDFLNVSDNFLVSPTFPEDDIEDGCVSEQLWNDYSDEDVFKKKTWKIQRVAL